MKSLELLHGRYLRSLRRKNYSPATIEDADYNLSRHLRRFLDETKLHPLKVTTTALRRFQSWLPHQPKKRGGGARGVANVNRVLAQVKGFFRFLKTEGYRPDDPAEKVEAAREPRSLPRNVLTPQEAKRIIDSVDTSTVLGYRDRTILEVFYATGIRRNELRNLRVEDVNLEEGLLRINEGKGGHDRVVPLSRMAARFLENYLKGVRPEILRKGKNDPAMRGTGRLFLSLRGRPLDRNILGYIVKKRARLAGVDRKISCHVWRQTCATHLLKNNANLRHVQALLGHQSLATTERYLHLTITDLKAAHRRCHPRERERHA
jgi:integrase/recombinase XerD